LRFRVNPAMPDPLLLALGRRVRALRRERHWTLERASQASGISVRFLADVEAGRGNISIARLALLAKALGRSIPELLAEPAPLRVALLGLRGAGKSTVGSALAERLGVPFVELDAVVEEAAGLPLAELFAVHGEATYRRLEREALARVLADARPAVIAVGGGLVTDRETYAMLRRSCVTVWLRARPEEHMQRVSRQGDLRPMARRSDAMAELTSILAARAPLYAEADHVVDTSGVPVEGVVLRVREAIGRAA
jgi:XRE family aerobic/anaerobic benzoate catabolism transcriptional regulator